VEDAEAALVARVADGDQAAYRQLLQHHLAPLSHYSRRMLADDAAADDVVQEVFLRLWTDARRYRPEKARLTTWLHRIAHNLCVDWHRREGRLEPLDDEAPAGRGDGPEHALGADERAAGVRAAVAALPERQRSALVLCHYQGISNRDAAAIIGVSVDALESLLARARRTLRSQLENNHEA
jgi:RNA polymerase sigma-70 factor (ECF subfamily)